MKKFLSVLLAVMMVLSTVSFAAPSAVATMDSAELPAAEEVVETVVEETAALAAELPEDSATYGNLLFELNFNNLTSISEQKIKFTDAGVVTSHAYEYVDDYADITFSAYPTYTIKERAAGDKYLELSGGTGYAVTQFNSNTNYGFQTEDGVYTLTADVYRPDAMPITTRFSGGSSEDTPIQDFSGLNDAGWGSIILQHDETCFGNGGHATPFDSINDVRSIKFHRNGGTDAKTVGYDNIRLYYKPLTVKATVTANGTTKTVDVPTTGAYAADFAKAFNLDFYQTATGVKVNGVTYGVDEAIYVTEDCEAEIVIGEVECYDVEKGIALFNIDFEQAEIGTEIPNTDSQFKVGNYATSVAASIMSHDPSNWHLNSANLVYYVYADPADPSNKVAGFKNGTNGGYPALILNTYSNSTMSRYGFVEDPESILTIDYDYYDTTADGIAIRFGGRSSVAENENLSKWATLEDTCNEASYDRAASTWYKNVGTYTPANVSRMGGVDEISFVKMHTASPANADVYFDNVKLFYKPTKATVTFADVSGATFEKNTVENVSTTGVVVSDLLDEVGFEYDDFLFVNKGVTVGNGTTVYGINDEVVIGGNVTINVVLEEKDLTGWLDNEKGLLLFDIDFEDPRAASFFTPETGNVDYNVASFAKVNPYVADAEDWNFSISGMDMVGVENGAVKIQWDGTGKWPQVLIGHSNNSLNKTLMGENGTYYVHADYKILDAVDSQLASIAIQSNGLIDGVHKGPSGILPMGNDFYASRGDLVADTWLTIEGSSKSTWTNDTDGLDNDDISKITTVFTHNANPGTVGGYYLMDNIKLWWKPATINLTVYPGSNAEYEKVTLKGVSSTLTVDELVALLPGSAYGKITGFADMEGNRLDSLSFVTNSSVVAIWTPWVVLEGGQEFATDAKGISGGGSGQWSGSYGNRDEIGDGGGQVTGAISNMYSSGWYTTGGNLYNVQDTVAIGENNAGGTTAEWSVPAVHSITDMIRENINTNLAAGNDAEYVLVKYRYDNLPNLAEVAANDPNPEGKKYTLSDDGNSLTYYGRAGTTQYTFEMAPDYFTKMYIQCQDGSYQYGGGEEFHQNELMKEDYWYFDLLPVNAVMKEKGVKCVIVQTYNRFDGQITEYDYVRFVKLGEEEEVVLPEIDDGGSTVKVDAPVSLEDATEMRMEEGKDNGLRFKATMTSEANNAAATIGWAVVSYDKFMASNSSYDALTVDSEGVKLGYQRLEGTNLANFFDTSDDEALVFAAVLKGIPDDNLASYIIARPFICVEGTYYYGSAFATSMYDIAAEIYYGDAYNELTPEQVEYIEYVVFYCEDNGLV